MPGDGRQPVLEPLDPAIDHVRGPATARLIAEYGDYKRPYPPAAYRSLERVRRDVRSGQVLGTPTLFIDGVVHGAGYDVLLRVLGE